jgi:hypothetical protein
MKEGVAMRTVCCLCLLVLAAGCGRPRPPAPLTRVSARAAPVLPAGPADAAWNAAPEFVARLIPQDLVEPRLLEPSTPEVRVRALATATAVAFRLEWDDPSQDDTAAGARFCDACALQVPVRAEASLPAPQMGEPGKPVEILYWSADWQARADGRGDHITDLYPNASVDHYPFEAASLEKGSPTQLAMAARYAPARALGNALADPHPSAAQALVAEGPGTIAPNRDGRSSGCGVRTARGWSVALTRPLPDGMNGPLRPHVAFAVWQGAAGEVGPRKMRTGWIALERETP